MTTFIDHYPPELWQPHPSTRFLEDQLRAKYPPFTVPPYWIPKTGPDGLRYVHLVSKEEWKRVMPEWKAELVTMRWHYGYIRAHKHPPGAQSLDKVYRFFLALFEKVYFQSQHVSKQVAPALSLGRIPLYPKKSPSGFLGTPATPAAGNVY